MAETPQGSVLMALGPVNEAFRATLRTQFFPQYLADWTVAAEEPPSTDALWDAVQAAEAPWQAVLVTDRLTGAMALAGVLGAIAIRWPACHIAVLAAGDTPATRTLIGQLAVFRCYNVLWTDPNPESLLRLMTQPTPWETIAPFLDPAHPVAPPALPAVLSGLSVGGLRPAIREHDPIETVVAHQTIAVISGKGGVGKSGWLANMAVAAAPWGSVIVDADYLHPSVISYFQDPALPLAIDLRQLITTLQARRPDYQRSKGWQWTESDQATIRRYVDQAVTLLPGVQLIPGPSRANPVPVVPPPGLIAELAAASVPLGRITWIDTPSLPTDDVFIDAVRVADRIVCITTPAYPAVLETIDLLRKLDLLHVPRKKLSLVVNRRARAGFSTYDLTHVHVREIPLLGIWAEDPDRWERSMESHRPLALTSPKVWRQALLQLTGLQDTPGPRRKGWLGKKVPAVRRA